MKGRGPAIVLGLVGAALFLWPARSGLLGNPGGETHNHVWALAQARLGLLANVPEGWTVPLMDPPNLLWFSLGWLVSPAVAWNFTAFANVALGLAGGAWLGHEVSRSRAGTIVAAAAVGFSPFLSGVLDFGVTEAWPLGLYAGHVAAMERLRERPDRRTTVLAGVLLAAFALSGWYNAAFALVVSPLLALRVARREALFAGALAAVIVLPRALGLLPHLGVWEERTAALSDPTRIRAWMAVERYGIDLLRFLPTRTSFSPSYSVYLGVIVVLLALYGRRRSLPWLAMATPLWVLALGHWLRVGGVPVTLEGPLLMPAGWLVDRVELLRYITHWYRAAGPATVLLAAAAAVGAGALERGLGTSRLAPALGPLLGLLILADSLAFSGTRWPRVAAPLPDAPFVELAGPVLDLPVDDNRTEPSVYGTRRPYWLFQVQHGAPVAENYEAADSVLARSGEARALQAACGGLPSPRPGAARAGEITPGSEAVTLAELGFVEVIVHRRLAPAGCEAGVEARFGPPAETNELGARWRIAQP